jgi:hypothetical protein
MKDFAELLKNLPQILELVSQDRRALAALVFIVMAFLAVAFFPKERLAAKLVVFFALLILGGAILEHSIAEAQRDLLTVELTGNTFVPYSKTHLPQISGCSCDDGNSKVSFLSPAQLPINSIDTKAGQPAIFFWDASYVCHHQGIKGFPANIGHMTFDGAHPKTIPDLWGTAKVTYGASSGDPHSVRVDVAARCYDTFAHCEKECNASGELSLNVGPKK